MSEVLKVSIWARELSIVWQMDSVKLIMRWNINSI